MRHPLTILAVLFLCAAPAQAQTMKALMYNTNGQVVYGGSSDLTLPESVVLQSVSGLSGSAIFKSAIAFDDVESAGIEATTRANLGFSTNLNALWTATNAESARNAIGAGTGGSGGTVDLASTNATGVLPISKGGTSATNAIGIRQAIELGQTNNVTFNTVTVGSASITLGQTENGGIAIGGQGTPNIATIEANGMFLNLSNYGYGFGTNNPQGAGITRTNLGLGATNIVTFAGLTNNGDIRINQTTATNGLLYVYRTNNEPFLGLANLIASNNTTVSNETLFRVGVAEATNRAAQFGFRSTNTNGNGVAVFSVFGFNALMQIGADASTNAVIYSGGGTNNEVMTLIKNGATEFARPIAFSTTAHAAVTRTNLGLGAASDPTFRDVSVRDLSIVGGSGGKIVYPSTNTAPTNTTNVAAWIQVNVGTNAYRVPLYQ